MDKLQAIGIGNPVADLLINIDKLPGPDQAAKLMEISYQFGGKVPTAIAALGRLGVPCGMIGVVGDDDEGHACVSDFALQNVDASRMIIDRDTHTRMSVVLSDRSGERNFLRREEKVRTPKPEELEARREYIEQAAVLHLSAAGPAERAAAEWVRRAGGRVSFDADGYKPEYEDMAGLIDAFITSESYYTSRYPGKDMEYCCRDIADKGPAAVVVTLGSKGCACFHGGKLEMVLAYKVKVVDATGAGDTFHGAYIYGMLKGWDAVGSARFASAVSAIKCMAIGGRVALPTLDMVQRFLDSGGKDVDMEEIARRKALYVKPHGLQSKR